MHPSMINRLLELAVAIQQIPSPTFEEARRAHFVHDQFVKEKLSNIFIDGMGNVFARLPGRGAALPLVVSAHLDTVFPESTDLEVTRDATRIAGAGIGDNSIGIAGLFGLVWELKEQTDLPGDLWLVANVGEEGLGDLAGMRAVVDRFGEKIKAYLILEGMALGQVYHRGLGVARYEITINTGGGHSWVDYGAPSAINEMASLVNRLAAIPLPDQPRTTLNVGVISGGTSINTIAAQASCLIDLRSEEKKRLDELATQVKELVRNSRKPDVQVSARVIGKRPSGMLPTSHPLIILAKHCLEAQGIRPRLNIGSTDANIPLSRGMPAICLGLTTGRGAHTKNEYIDIPPLYKGMAQLVEFVKQVYAK